MTSATELSTKMMSATKLSPKTTLVNLLGRNFRRMECHVSKHFHETNCQFSKHFRETNCQINRYLQNKFLAKWSATSANIFFEKKPLHQQSPRNKIFSERSAMSIDVFKKTTDTSAMSTGKKKSPRMACHVKPPAPLETRARIAINGSYKL